MDSKKSNPNFYVQWHITDRCSQRCKHCYIFQSQDNCLPVIKELDINILSLIVKDVFKTADTLNANAIFVLTGGDPILHPDFWQLLELINFESKKFRFKTAIDILGNPFFINDDKALKMKQYGIRKYQLSLDGLKDVHDFLRKPGSYQATLNTTHILRNAGIKSTCMFTLSKFNALDLIQLLKEVIVGSFDSFAFARFCRPSNMPLEKYQAQMFTPLEYKNLLTEIYQTYQELTKDYPNFKFVFKDHLWELFFYEKYSHQQVNKLQKIRKDKIVFGGCSLGIASLSILSDGTVYACRRFSSPIGRVPDQKLIDLFINSEQLNAYRNLKLYKKCKKCPLLYTCRGCGAVAYGVSNSFFDPDPQCWYSV